MLGSCWRRVAALAGLSSIGRLPGDWAIAGPQTGPASTWVASCRAEAWPLTCVPGGSRHAEPACQTRQLPLWHVRGLGRGLGRAWPFDRARTRIGAEIWAQILGSGSGPGSARIGQDRARVGSRSGPMIPRVARSLNKVHENSVPRRGSFAVIVHILWRASARRGAGV